MKGRIIIGQDGRKFYVSDIEKDFHTQFGFIKKTDLKKKNKVIKTNTGAEFVILEPYFIDVYRKLKRHAQIIMLKDIGIIVSETGINKNSVVVDAGSGSGALSLFLANIAKKVYTFDVDDRAIKVVRENINLLELKNVILKKVDVYTEIPVKNADVVILDLKEPWDAIKNAKKSLKIGGFLVLYTPQVTQVIETLKCFGNDFLHLKTVELIERDWEFRDKIARPKNIEIGHTGFLTFARKVR
jgi:tRNA (adenine57-N1/adenine58-N1)-methyltransferase catalytic subunit